MIKTFLAAGLSMLLLASASPVLADGDDVETPTMSFGTWGFDTSMLSPEISPGDDFFAFANQKWLERTITQDIVTDILQDFFLLGDRHDKVLDRNDVIDDIANFLACRLWFHLGQLRQINCINQSGKNARFCIVIFF